MAKLSRRTSVSLSAYVKAAVVNTTKSKENKVPDIFHVEYSLNAKKKTSAELSREGVSNWPANVNRVATKKIFWSTERESIIDFKIDIYGFFQIKLICILMK